MAYEMLHRQDPKKRNGQVIMWMSEAQDYLSAGIIFWALRHTEVV